MPKNPMKQAPLIPPLVPVVPVRLIIEIEHGAVSAVYSSDPNVKVEILDDDAVAVGNVRPKDAAKIKADAEAMTQVY